MRHSASMNQPLCNKHNLASTPYEHSNTIRRFMSDKYKSKGHWLHCEHWWLSESRKYTVNTGDEWNQDKQDKQSSKWNWSTDSQTTKIQNKLSGMSLAVLGQEYIR